MNLLKNFDWYYAYSDDHSVWKRGRDREGMLRSTLERIGCPYSMSQLRMAVHEMVVEDFAEEEPNEWYRQPRIYKSTAPVQRKDLMHRADQVQILAWIEQQEI